MPTLAEIDAACAATETLEQAAQLLGISLCALKGRRKRAFAADPTRPRRPAGRKLGSPGRKNVK